MRSFAAELPEGHGSVYKEVRFSPTATPLRRAQSLSAAGPGRARYDRPTILERTRLAMDTSYIDQSHDLLSKQQKHFQAERELFDHERRLWEKERSLLRSRIDELEAVVNTRKSRSNGSASHPRPSFGLPQYQSGSPNHYPTAQVWEGSSPGSLPTRVFRDEKIADNNRLSPLIEGLKAPSLDAALSPRASTVDGSGTTVSVPVPIEKLDSRLDGITLKSTALPAEVVARVITPPSPSSQEPSPSGAPSAAARPEIEHRNSLKLKLSELGPPNENLVRDAGHTPMAIIEADGSMRTTQEATPLSEPQAPGPEEEAPLAPIPTHVRLPPENAESYFPDVPDDPALKGPLGLTNDEELDSSFLNALDQKLLDQARRILSTSADEDVHADEDKDNSELPNEGGKEPEIKFKNSTNFGTAFGTT